MLAGPGAISTAIVLHKQAANFGQRLALFGCIGGVCLASYLILRFAASGAKWFSPIAMKITVRVMGLLLAAVAVQFMLNALKELRTDFFAMPK